MRKILAAVATATALAVALPATAAVTLFGGRTYLELLVGSGDGVGGVSGDLAFSYPSHAHGYTSGAQTYGDQSELLDEASSSALLTIDGSISDSLTTFQVVASGTGMATSYVPDRTVFAGYQYEIETSFTVDSVSRLRLSYQDGERVRLLSDGSLVADLDLSGHTGQKHFALTPGASYSLFLSGGPAHLAHVVGVGSMTATDIATYGVSITSVPEPGAWALMILGFGAAGSTLRRRQGASERKR